MKHNRCVTREIFGIYCYNLMVIDDIKLEVGVKVLLVSPENKVLFLRRNPTVYDAKQTFLDIPGGRIHNISSLADNLAREVLEETGKVISGDLEILSAQDIWFDCSHIVRITYISRVTDEVVRLSAEHVGFEWICIDGLQSRLLDFDPFITEVIKDKMSFIRNFLSKSVERNGKT